MTITATVPMPGVERSKLYSVVFASSLGTIIEWYDFLIYATAAALVFNKAFFPTFDPLAGTLAALGSYAVGFLARPLGGALFGHFGDRLGRKSMLVLTLFIMGISTFCIGLLPTYASIGVFAPILLILLRVIQGIGLGGEWGGASLMVLEHAPSNQRGFYTSFVQIGFPIGLVLATLVFALVTKLPEADFASYGWRIPFLISIVLLAIGTFVRSRVPETPVFEELKARNRLAKNPVGDVVAKNGRTFLIAVGLKLSDDVRDRVLLLPGIVRTQRPLQRRLVRLPGIGGDRRRLRTDHRHCDGRIFRRHRRRIDHDDRAGADHAGGGAGGAGNQRRAPDRLTSRPGDPARRFLSHMTGG